MITAKDYLDNSQKKGTLTSDYDADKKRMTYSLTSRKNISYKRNWIKFLLAIVRNCQFQILNKAFSYQRFVNSIGNICSLVLFQKYRYLKGRDCLWKKFLRIFSLAI